MTPAASTSHQIRHVWEEVAARTLRHVDLGPGRSFLNVAAGSGALSIAAACTGADVTAVDVSPTVIVRLEERSHSEKLDIETHVMDGAHLDFEDDSFDVVSVLSDVSTFLDVVTRLAEMMRVTRPCGQVQVVALGSVEEARFRNFFGGAGLSEVRVIAEQTAIPIAAAESPTTELTIAIGTKL